MGRRRDEKLQSIAESVVGRRCSQHDLTTLGRRGDLIRCAAGSTFHPEAASGRWAYLLLDGDVALSQHGDPLAVATGGSWFPLHGGTAGSRTSLTALSDSRLLVFRASETASVLDLPALGFAV
ncbi:MAG: hypothetical protein ACJ739_09650 [Acidimicrobiales bacterium]